MNFHYTFDWNPLWEHRDMLASGFLMTVQLSVVSLFCATLAGIAIGTCSALGPRPVRALAITWVEFVRNIPLLIHMYIWYMALAFLQLPAFACAVLALTIYSSSYVSEIVRAGITSLPRGQRQAAAASGLTPMQSLRLVVYPQVFRAIAPSLASVFSQLIKDSSLASVIAVAEITYQAGALDGLTFRTFEIYAAILVLYLVLVTIVNQALAWVLRRRVSRTPGDENVARKELSDA
jgi:His/Glu/Gln/Arg/opine family amino acid ABC transporter permease subunit